MGRGLGELTRIYRDYDGIMGGGPYEGLSRWTPDPVIVTLGDNRDHTVDGGNLAPLLPRRFLTAPYPSFNIGIESLQKQICSNDGNLAPPQTKQLSMLKRGAGMRRHVIEMLIMQWCKISSIHSIRVLSYSYYTTITGWELLLRDCIGMILRNSYVCSRRVQVFSKALMYACRWQRATVGSKCARKV